MDRSRRSDQDPVLPRARAPLSTLPASLTLTLRSGGNPVASEAMRRWAAQLEREAGGRVLIRRDWEQALEQAVSARHAFAPSLGLLTETGSVIHYHFVPQGMEEAAFRDLLWQVCLEMAGIGPAEDECEPTSAAGSATLARSSSRARIEKPGIPALPELRLFVARSCPNCPAAMLVAHSLALEVPGLRLDVFEAGEAGPLAATSGVRSVPTLLVGEGLRFVGRLPRGRVLSLLQDPEPEGLLRERVRHFLQEGLPQHAARLIAATEAAALPVEDLLRSTFTERVGLLLALEEALEINPRCLDPVAQRLLPGLQARDASLRGDLADLLGRIGHAAALPGLRRLLRDPNPDVAEAAAEAVERIAGNRPR